MEIVPIGPCLDSPKTSTDSSPTIGKDNFYVSPTKPFKRRELDPNEQIRKRPIQLFSEIDIISPNQLISESRVSDKFPNDEKTFSQARVPRNLEIQKIWRDRWISQSTRGNSNKEGATRSVTTTARSVKQKASIFQYREESEESDLQSGGSDKQETECISRIPVRRGGRVHSGSVLPGEQRRRNANERVPRNLDAILNREGMQREPVVRRQIRQSVGNRSSQWWEDNTSESSDPENQVEVLEKIVNIDNNIEPSRQEDPDSISNLVLSPSQINRVVNSILGRTGEIDVFPHQCFETEIVPPDSPITLPRISAENAWEHSPVIPNSNSAYWESRPENVIDITTLEDNLFEEDNNVESPGDPDNVEHNIDRYQSEDSQEPTDQDNLRRRPTKPKEKRSRRIRKVRRDKKLDELLSAVKIQQLSRKVCCSKNCLFKIGVRGIKLCRADLLRLDSNEQNVMLRTVIDDANREESRQKMYTLRHSQVCRIAFKSVYNLGNTRLNRLNAGEEDPRMFRDPVRRESTSTFHDTTHWMNTFFTKNVERLPNNSYFHLPDSFTKKEVYEMYVGELTGGSLEIVGYSYFCRVWNQEFNKIKIPKKNRFATCSICAELKTLKEKAVSSETKRKLCKVF